MSPKYNNCTFHHSILIVGLSAFLLFFILPTELYGSTIPCDPSTNLTNSTSCDEKTSSPSSSTADRVDDDEKTSSPSSSSAVGDENTGTTLVLPDISPTDKDLGTGTDLDASDTDSGNNNNDDSGGDDTRESEEENNDDSGNNEDESSGDDASSLIPFP